MFGGLEFVIFVKKTFQMFTWSRETWHCRLLFICFKGLNWLYYYFTSSNTDTGSLWL